MKTIIKRLDELMISFITNDSHTSAKSNKLKAFDRLEASRKNAKTLIDYDAEREKSMNEKYGM